MSLLNRLAHHIDSNVSIPVKYLSDGTTNPVFQAWEQKDQQGLSWILTTVSQSLLHYIVSFETVCEAWEKLTCACACGSRSNSPSPFSITQ